MSKHHKSKETLLNIEGTNLDGLSLREFDCIVSERFGTVCGIDEAGRGPIAGDIFAAAVILDSRQPIDGLNDSKKLTPKKREALYDEICEKAVDYCVSRVTVQYIDKSDILTSDLLAMRNAYEQLKRFSGIVLVDGDVLPEIIGDNVTAKNVIGGDAKSEAVAAASILAKVERDRYMIEMARVYPCYGFEKHKGYGTKAHYAAIEQYGLCPIHRKSFLKKYLNNE